MGLYILGSSLILPAHGRCGARARKNKSASPREDGSAGRFKGGMPSRPSGSPAAPPEYLEGGTEQKNILFLFRRKNRARAKSEMRRIFFCEVAAGALAEAGGGAGQSVFRSKKVRAKDIISPPIETSRFERVAPRGREAAALRKMARRFAAKWLGGENSKRADLSVSYQKTI